VANQAQQFRFITISQPKAENMHESNKFRNDMKIELSLSLSLSLSPMIIIIIKRGFLKKTKISIISARARERQMGMVINVDVRSRSSFCYRIIKLAFSFNLVSCRHIMDHQISLNLFDIAPQMWFPRNDSTLKVKMERNWNSF
jgi:hypothetical protein